MKRHITLPIDTQMLKNDERMRTSFIEMFGSDAYTRAIDPDAPDGTYDYSASDVKSMSDEEFEKNREAILHAASKGRVKQSEKF